ncbi:MAG: hypothetical protein Kow0042_16670 [Calditrichia bacterium]
MQIIHRLVGIYFIMLLVFASCGETQTADGDYQIVKPQELAQWLENKKEMLIIDVRTPGEYVGELGHIEGSLLRPLQEMENWISEFEKNKNDRIVMVCRSGNRSGVSSRYFSRHGFKNVYNLQGGMRAWNKAGLPISRSKPEAPHE